MEYSRIPWDHQAAKPYAHSAPTPIDLVKWISDKFWPMSYRSQREFCGLIFRRNSGKCVMTVHRSSFQKANLDAGRFSHQPNDVVSGRNVIGRWHTHISYIAYKSDSKDIKDDKAFLNTWSASTIWDSNDTRAVDRVREFFPQCVGYIISEHHIGIYDPDARPQTQWLEYKRCQSRN